MNCLEHLSQCALLVPEQLASELLEDEVDVVENHYVVRSHSPRLQQRPLGVLKLPGLKVGSRQVLQDLDVGMFEELLQAVFIHLDGGDVLLLLHVDVSNIQPHVTKVSRGFTDLNQVERSYIS